MKIVLRLLAAVAVLGAVQSSSLAVASAAGASAEQQFVALVNNERVSRGLRPLAFHAGLTSLADDWTDVMVSRSRGCGGGLAHNPRYSRDAPAGWTSLAENVACGGSVKTLHKLMMSSPMHRANILGDFNAGGVGVAVARSGTVWVTELYATYPGT